ncbi:MAG TPA: heavy metal-binding domain-containing protein [Candidatus Sulfotelmatobacter sp.]|jgi:multidrug efflux pump subunit AcrA (membrane-fusion protein)|nr:heavy metal-binding domain-containing protein [Candidatus Sulfotelmatobacter sp.]
MKTKLLLVILLLAAGGGIWLYKNHPAKASSPAAPAKGERKILYYQSAMHPWIKSDKPGKCPICGMDLVPVYEGDAMAMSDTNLVSLNKTSISAVNVQSEIVAKHAVTRTIRVLGTIEKNSSSSTWFVFDVYDRDLPWLKSDQKMEVTLSSVPGKNYPAQLQSHGTQTFADRNFDEASGSTKFRARILETPVEVPGFAGKAYFSGLQAASQIRAATPEVLAVPRSALILRGDDALAYLDHGDGHYESRVVKLGRIGDEYAEVLDGLDEGDKVVTHGNLLIDAEAQLTKGE